MKQNRKRNKYTFGLGTIGRDMVYSMVSMYLIYYLTDIIELPTSTLWWITVIVLCARIFDALNDPIMGVIVDNTKTRFGKFKPWIALGGFGIRHAYRIAFHGFRSSGGGIYCGVCPDLYRLGTGLYRE